MVSVLKSIEKWASESPERERLLIILIFAGFGVIVLLSTLVLALFMLSPSSGPS